MDGHESMTGVLELLKSLAVSILIPPFGFATLAALSILLPVGNRLRAFLSGTAIVGLIALGMPVVADTLLQRLEVHLPSPTTDSPPPRAIVVLGAEVRHTTETPSVVVAQLAQGYSAFSSRLRDHEASENDMVQQAITDDLGGGG